jgi:hypothetical protein
VDALAPLLDAFGGDLLERLAVARGFRLLARLRDALEEDPERLVQERPFVERREPARGIPSRSSGATTPSTCFTK